MAVAPSSRSVPRLYHFVVMPAVFPVSLSGSVYCLYTNRLNYQATCAIENRGGGAGKWDNLICNLLNNIAGGSQ